MKANGKMISHMVLEHKFGRIKVLTRVNIQMVRNMDLASIVGQTEVTIRVNGILIECMEKGNSNGPMVDNMKGIGETT